MLQRQNEHARRTGVGGGGVRRRGGGDDGVGRVPRCGRENKAACWKAAAAPSGNGQAYWDIVSDRDVECRHRPTDARSLLPHATAC